MKTMTFVLVTLLVAIASVGFSCINDSFLVAVNLPLTVEYKVNPGPAGVKIADTTVYFKDQIDQSYVGKIQNVRYYDSQVSTIGTYSGSVPPNGQLLIDNQLLLSFHGNWNDFNTPQSVLGSSPLVTPNNAGVAELLAKLNQFIANQNTSVHLAGSCTLVGPDVPAGLRLRVQILCQVDAEVGS